MRSVPGRSVSNFPSDEPPQFGAGRVRLHHVRLALEGGQLGAGHLTGDRAWADGSTEQLNFAN